MELISIIVPIYEVEEFLLRCIESLINQTYKHTDIILVDDGSPDRCPEICDEYAEQDARIQVIHKANGGLSDARNAGLAVARGELIAFVDSDDWVSPYYLQLLYETMTEEKADIVECGFIRSNGHVPVMESVPTPKRTVYDAEQALLELITEGLFRQIVWNKLYTREVLDGISFAIGKRHEDEFYTYQVFGRAHKLVRIDAELYYYFQRSGSIMNSAYTLKNLEAVEARAQRQDYMREHFSALEAIAGTELFHAIIFEGQFSMKYLSKEERKQAFVFLEAYKKKYFSPLRYRFQGKKSHVIEAYLSLISLKAVCKVRSLLLR